MTSLSSAMTRNNAIPTLRRAAEHPSHVRCTPSRPQRPIGIRNTDNCRELHANCLGERMRADDVFCADATLPARQPTKPSDGGHPLPRVPRGSRPGTAGQAVGVAQGYAWARIGGVAALRPSTLSRRWWGASVNGSPAASQTLFSAP